MTFVDVVSTWRAALVDLESGVGVAVELPPPCDCASCLVAWWEDRTAWEGELLAHDVAVVQLLPDMPGRLTCMTLAPCAAWDEDGHEVALWGPDALPIHEDGAGAVEGHPALAGLWEELAHLVEELDGEAAR